MALHAIRGVARRVTHRLSLLRRESVGFAKKLNPPTDKRTQKSPARFPGRAHFVSFNLPNTPILASRSRYSQTDEAANQPPRGTRMRSNPWALVFNNEIASNRGYGGRWSLALAQHRGGGNPQRPGVFPSGHSRADQERAGPRSRHSSRVSIS